MMDQPAAIEIITAVKEFIEKHAMPQLAGHTAFHARVAANALAVVIRELEQGPAAGYDEAARLRHLLNRDGSLDSLNRELCRRLRENEMPIDNPALIEHLRLTTLAKVAIDQPTYSGYVNSPHKR